MSAPMAASVERHAGPRYRVIIGSPIWSLNGVNIFSMNLARGLIARGIPATILLTRPHERDAKPMVLPEDVPVEHLPLGSDRGLADRWIAVERYLEERAPCIYIPNHDYEHSCIVPRLSDNIAVVGVVHSTDVEHQQHVGRLGSYWNATVAVSTAVAERMRGLDSGLLARTTVIPHGVEIPESFPRRGSQGIGPIKIVYAGRLVDYQKRVFDLPTIMAQLQRSGVAAELTIIGSGADERRLRKMCAPAVNRGTIIFAGILEHRAVLEAFRRSDVFILTSEVEGGPLVLLEAMAQGCVPVVTDIRSAMTELVRDDVNGYRIPVGALSAFTQRLAALSRDPERRRDLSAQAYRTIAEGAYGIGDMVERYVAVFERVWHAIDGGAFVRPRGAVSPLPPPRIGWKARLAGPLRVLDFYRRKLFNAF